MKYNSIVVTSRLDIRLFADLVSFLHSQGLKDPKQGTVAKLCLEILHAKLVEENVIQPIDDPIEAKNLLDQLEVINVAPGRRGYRHFIKSVQEKTLREDFGSTDYLSRGGVKHIRREEVNECELDDAMKAIQELEKKRNEEFKKQQQQMIPKGVKNETK